MNPDRGEDAEDWFARFEREAREAAQQRDPQPIEPASPTQLPPHPPAIPPLVEPAPPAREPEPTQAMPQFPVEPEPTQAMPQFPVEPEPTQALVPAAPFGASDEPGSALDQLFGDDRFREYAPGLDPSQSPFASRSTDLVLVDAPDGAPPARAFGPLQKALVGVGAGLLAILALIALFFLGTRLPDVLGPAPAIVTPSASPSPSMSALPVGPVSPGTYDWDELAGGECLDPFVDAWQEEYAVVDCTDPHAGQLLARAWFPEAVAGAAFPGETALAAQIALLCSAPTVLDLAAAGQYTDAQVQGSYPVTRDQWDADPSYYCFVSRSTGEPLTGSVAVAPAPAG